MAKAAAPSKKTAKAAKVASTGAKKARKTKRTETFSSYIHKVLKQVHPGESLERGSCAGGEGASAADAAQQQPAWRCCCWLLGQRAALLRAPAQCSWGRVR